MKKNAILPSLCFAVLSTMAYEQVVEAAENETPISEVSQAATTQFVKVNPGSHLNLRAAGTPSATILGSLANGTKVSVLSAENGWAKVRVKGKVGFVSTKFLTGGAGTAKVATTVQFVKVNPSSSLNLRASASTNATVITSLANGTKVTVLSENNGWAKVQVNGREGFVSLKYLSSGKSSSSLPTDSGTTSTPAPAKTVSANLPAPVKTVSSSSSAPAETADSSALPTRLVKVNPSSVLNLRTAASTNSSILTRLANGTKVTVLSEEYGWAKVSVNGKVGYASSKYLAAPANLGSSGSTASAKASTSNVRTSKGIVDVNRGSSLNMRNKPTTNASIMLKLARGVEVTILSESNGWAKVKVYGQEGYVSLKYLKTVKSESVPAPVTNTADVPVTNTTEIPAPNTPKTEQEKSGPSDQTVTLKYVNVNQGSVLNMRSQPSTKGSILDKLAPGTEVTVHSEAEDWAKVSVNGKTGYVSKAFLITKSDAKNGTIVINTIYENYDLTLDEFTTIQMSANPQTDKPSNSYIREDALVIHNEKSATVQGTGWNVRSGAGTDHSVLGRVSNGANLKILSKVKGTDGYDWYQIEYTNSWVNASQEDVKYYLDPNTHLKNPITSLQFLKLSKPTSLDQFEVNEKILAGKGVLSGHAATFIEASRKYGVNDVYLISHALLETGNGTSQLAKGVRINGRTVYNMFGIGAYDGTAVSSGAKFAYDAGWFTPEAAIMGGAKFIAQGYIQSGQDTLYKMRWNPVIAVTTGAATHQYATDIGWATKQVNQIYNLYSMLDSYQLTLEIPTFKNL